MEKLLNKIKLFHYRIKVLNELINFLWQKKIWWLIPLIFILLLLIAVLAIESTAGIAPFIYTFI